MDRAVRDLGALIRLRPKDSSLFILRGCFKAFTKDYNGCAVDLTEAIRLEGGAEECDPEHFYLRGIALLNAEGETKRAAEACRYLRGEGLESRPILSASSLLTQRL